MLSFDFTALLTFIKAMFDAFAALAAKLGFSLDIGTSDDGDSADASNATA